MTSKRQAKKIRSNIFDDAEETLKFDLSHIPMKDDANEKPLYVGDVREKKRKKACESIFNN